MKPKLLRTLAFVAILPFVQTLSAELPMLEQPWLGYFAIAEDDAYRFYFATTGSWGIYVLNGAGTAIDLYPFSLQFFATETLPDGSLKSLPMKLDTLESTDQPSAKLKKTVFRSKLTDQLTGQPTLEVSIEIASGNILANARIMDKGSFDKNPLVPTIQLNFCTFYAQELLYKATWDKKVIKDFDKQIKKDFVSLKHLSGKTVKLGGIEKSELKPEEINGTGSSEVVVDFRAYQGRKIEFIATPNSSLKLLNPGVAPLHGGFSLQWSPDLAKDPECKAKLAIKIN